MLEKLNAMELRYESLQAQLSDAAIYTDAERLRNLQRELGELSPIIETYRNWKQAGDARKEAERMLSDPELKDLAREEWEAETARQEQLRDELRVLLLPKNPDDDKNVILEIRSGVGGEEGALFARSLLRMYMMYAQKRGWKTEFLNLNETELGGVRECALLVEGGSVYARLKFESGVHRVQRVPETESAGRVHTSAATVAVLPEAEEVDLRIDPKELKIDTYRSSGAGGQHVNKTESAIRITHLPTGLVVECQDERSQFKNRDKAMKVLRSRLLDIERERRAAETAAERKSMVGSGDRSQRVRTYNFPQGRVTDHRIGLTLYQIDAIMDGALDELIDALITADRAEQLTRFAGSS